MLVSDGRGLVMDAGKVSFRPVSGGKIYIKHVLA